MKRALLAIVLVVAVGQVASASVVYDVVHGLYLNKPATGDEVAGIANGPVVQTGVENWWYWSHDVWAGGHQGPLTAAQMDPANYSIYALGTDGVGEPYGMGSLLNSRGHIKNGTWDPFGLSTGLTEGTALYVTPENAIHGAPRRRALWTLRLSLPAARAPHPTRSGTCSIASAACPRKISCS